MDKNINRIKAALADKLENPIESGPLFPQTSNAGCSDQKPLQPAFF